MMVIRSARPHIDQAREEEIFSCEDTPIEQRVLAGFVYHAGLSFRRIEPFVDVCHVAVHDWYHRLEHLFEPDRDRREAVAVDETKLDIEDEEVSVRAAVDVDTFEVLHIEVSPGRSTRYVAVSHGSPHILPRSAGCAG